MGNNIIGCLCRWICKFLTKILKFIICTFSLLLLGIMLFKILLYIDIRHAEIDEMIERFINKENYFKGEVWFSVIATCITAIPGIFCGAFALYQTFRIQKIEQQYHRPSLELYNATMQVWQIDNRNGFKEQISFENYLKAIEKKAIL